MVRVNVRLPERLRWLAPFVLGEAVRGAGFELVPFVGCPSDGAGDRWRRRWGRPLGCR